MKTGQTVQRLDIVPSSSFFKSLGKLRNIFIALFVAVVLYGTGHGVLYFAEQSLLTLYGSHLQTILKADITALKIWIANEKAHVGTWAQDESLRESIARLLGGQDVLLSRGEIMSILDSALYDSDYRGFAVIDPAGVIRASNRPDAYDGRRLDPGVMPVLMRVVGGETILEKPRPKCSLVTCEEKATGEPVMMAAAPVSDDAGKVIAALVLTINPDQDFTRILSVAQAGDTGDTYAFDRDGFMLSHSRFEDQMRQAGLIPDTPEQRAVFNVQIRDPGGDLTAGFQPDTVLEARPLTRMAAAAAAGLSGMDLDGYRDYRGVEVIGAWQWLGELGFGVATEVERREVMRTLGPIRLAFMALYGCAVCIACVMLFGFFRLRFLQSRIEQVQQLGQYRLVKKIGQGGMGTVYRAQHALLKRPTAVKVLNAEAMSAEGIARFEREVQLTSTLTHPNTIIVYDYGHTPEGQFYYAMEYVPGITLERLLDIAGPLPPARVICILRQACGCLEEAHGAGLAHRDIKPQNIMLCERGGTWDMAKVLDFGLVKDITESAPEKTTAQGVLGSPGFIAPERLTEPSGVDVRSDLYSLAAVGFRLLTGRDVFEAATAVEVCYHVMNTPAPRVSELSTLAIPAGLDRLISDCLQKNPDVRSQTARAMIEALDAITDAGAWTQDDARQWWQQHAARINPA